MTTEKKNIHLVFVVFPIFICLEHIAFSFGDKKYLYRFFSKAAYLECDAGWVGEKFTKFSSIVGSKKSIVV
jgi:hypothetical protein